MYKRRRLLQPSLPTTPQEADSAVQNSRYAELDGSTFYRGTVTSDDGGFAMVFASQQQLSILEESSLVYFDATFKVVPHLFYQLFTLFVPFSDNAFPVIYALMTRKTQAV